MSVPAAIPVQDTPSGSSKARQTLLRRLADVVCLPASRINAFERSVTGDLLVDLLRLASVEERRRVAVRLGCPI